VPIAVHCVLYRVFETIASQQAILSSTSSSLAVRSVNLHSEGQFGYHTRETRVESEKYFEMISIGGRIEASV